MLHVLENVRTTTSGTVLGDEVERASSRRTGRRPRRRRPGPAPTSSSGVARTAGSSTSPVGLFGEHRNVTVGLVLARRAAATSAGSSVKSAARSTSTTVAPVMRAMWACSWYVGSNVSDRAAGPGVREQQRLQHLVRAVGGEHLLRRDAVPVGDRRAQRRWPRGRGSGATRSRRARRRAPRASRPAAGTATRWCSAAPRRRPAAEW